jgi:diguanylate cyclase (GGDEF)-like protein
MCRDGDSDGHSLMEFYNFALMALEAAIYFFVLIVLLHFRARIGIGVFMTVLGTMHFLETYLAAKFYIALPFGEVSPGSAMMFSGKLLMILLLYIKEDATTVRQLIYGLLVGNFICLLFGFMLAFHAGNGPDGGVLLDDDFLRQMGILMVWGTTLLYLDSLAIIMLYERFGSMVGRRLVPRFLVAGILTLAFDQVGFFGVLHYLTGAPASVFWAGLAAKISMTAVYAAMTAVYLALTIEERSPRPVRTLADLFNDLTYREKYNDLLSRSGLDALTGVLDRGRLDRDGTEMVRAAMRRGRAFSLMVIDADHFKDINDRFGHLEGDEVLKKIAAAIKRSIRGGDQLYRFGGEEFIVLANATDHSEAITVAERIRGNVADSVRAGGVAQVTISVGVASGPQQGQSLIELISAADKSLYQAKADGRNRVQGEFTLVSS